jgi:hypothetical protein
MIPKRFEDIEFSDLEILLNTPIPEGKTIEYKELIPSNADSDKVKFLAGVCAFANTIGGDFIIGIKAKDGIPVDLSGLKLSDADLDAEILRLEQMLQNSIEPRLPSFRIKDDIKSPTGERFILVRVANTSWIAPHKVKVNEKFYGRNSKGKYPLDVSELRTAFMLTEQLSERIKNFRKERIQIIKSKSEAPAQLINGGKLILHLLPLASFITPIDFDVMELRQKAQFETTEYHDSEINLDGVVIAPSFEKETSSYTQIFRNGCIERVTCLNAAQGIRDDDKDFSSRFDEEQIISALSDFIDFYSKVEIELPVYLFLTFINIKDYEFHIDDEFRYHIEIRRKKVDNKKITFKRDEIIFPEIVINDNSQSPQQLLRSTFNKLWNSVGLTRDLNYDENGNWIDDLRSLRY